MAQVICKTVPCNIVSCSFLYFVSVATENSICLFGNCWPVNGPYKWKDHFPVDCGALCWAERPTCAVWVTKTRAGINTCFLKSDCPSQPLIENVMTHQKRIYTCYPGMCSVLVEYRQNEAWIEMCYLSLGD